MTPKQINATLITGAAIVVVHEAIKIASLIHHGRKNREEIERNSANDIDAIHYARDQITEMIEDGLYTGKDLDEVTKDFNFIYRLRKAK